MYLSPYVLLGRLQTNGRPSVQPAALTGNRAGEQGTDWH